MYNAKENLCVEVGWIHMIHDVAQLRAFVNTVTNFWVS
jgi:hypothetical protein